MLPLLVYVSRRVSLQDLSRSVFLFGPRQTGKTTLLKQQFPAARWYNLLETDVFFRLSARPRTIRDEIAAVGVDRQSPVIIDEIQKLPVLLDEVQLLIDRYNLPFVLTGSSARKLVRSGSNLLGGRARVRRLFPLTSSELGEIDLERALRFGTLPGIWFSDDPADDLAAYCGTYLQQEIQQEGIVRRIDAFARFLRTAATMNAELVNYEAVASDAAVPARTVREYFEVLSDTLIAEVIVPFRRGAKRKAISTGKLFFFDVGVANTLRGVRTVERATDGWGKALEHFVYTELRAWLSYTRDDRPLTFWRTRHGQEVDFVIGDDLAVEVKAHANPGNRHLTGLRAIAEEGPFRHRILVYDGDVPPRIAHGIDILPLREFLERLWGGVWQP
ncbi:MAG: ATP-binding protein [Spirochaetaceae bacterium]|nr:MAG: ATP-binding protein [Spirochaetaceae bacterium]